MNYPFSEESIVGATQACGTPAGPEELAELASELRLLSYRIKRGLETVPEIPGVQRQQYWVLGALAECPRRMSDLAECAQTSQASLTGIVDRLEEHGLVRRTRSADDRRVVQVELTDEGQRISREAHTAMVTRLGQIIEPLTETERAEFLRLVRKLIAGDSA